MRKSKLNSITSGLFNDPVKEVDLLREVAPGKLVYKGRVLPVNEKNNLISQAKLIKSTPLTGLLLDEIKHLCEKKIYLDSKDQFDIAVGKMGLFIVEQLYKKIEKLSTMKQETVSKSE